QPRTTKMTFTFRVLVVATVALLLQSGVKADDDTMVFYQKGNFAGSCISCDITAPNLCFSYSGPSSSAILTNYATAGADMSVTYYTGPNCSGDWLRYSGQIGSTLRLKTLEKLNNKVRSFKVANFLTSSGTGHLSTGDTDVQFKCKKLASVACQAQ
ncbi:hypothetical protein BGX26_007619, partial [Mortierella sp. AD094]